MRHERYTRRVELLPGATPRTATKTRVYRVCRSVSRGQLGKPSTRRESTTIGMSRIEYQYHRVRSRAFADALAAAVQYSTLAECVDKPSKRPRAHMNNCLRLRAARMTVRLALAASIRSPLAQLIVPAFDECIRKHLTSPADSTARGRARGCTGAVARHWDLSSIGPLHCTPGTSASRCGWWSADSGGRQEGRAPEAIATQFLWRTLERT